MGEGARLREARPRHERASRRLIPVVVAVGLALTGLCLAHPSRALAATVLTVDNRVDDASWCTAQAHCSLRGAIAAASRSPGTTVINVTPGGYSFRVPIVIGWAADTNISIVGMGNAPGDVAITMVDGPLFVAYGSEFGSSALRISNVKLSHVGGNGPALVGRSGARISAVVDNVLFTGNGWEPNQDGGAIYWASEGALEIRNSNFGGNKAGRDGGAVFATPDSDVKISNTMFVDNAAVGSGGAIAFKPPSETTGARTGSPGGLTVTGTLFTGNSATDGAAIEADAASLHIEKSRIAGNSGPALSIAARSGGEYTGSHNWWGCNTGPNTPVCGSADAPFTESSWLVFGVAAPESPPSGAPTTITASVTRDSRGQRVDPVDLSALVNSKVRWTTTAGVLAGTDSKIGPDGTATMTLGGTGCETGTAAQATATVKARYDGQTIELPVVFACAASPLGPSAATSPSPLSALPPPTAAQESPRDDRGGDYIPAFVGVLLAVLAAVIWRARVPRAGM